MGGVGGDGKQNGNWKNGNGHLYRVHGTDVFCPKHFYHAQQIGNLQEIYYLYLNSSVTVFIIQILL